MVGEYEMLYTHLVSLIRKRFLESDNVFLCSLRMEILMAMHEVNVDYIVKIGNVVNRVFEVGFLDF